MSLHLHHADDAEQLAAVLWTVLRREPEIGRPPAGPGSAETIVVQSKGMARWLQLQMAETFGVCANVDFPFPRPFLEDALNEILGQESRSRHFDKERMIWAIAELLPEMMDAQSFAPLKRYMRRDDELGDGMRMQLAQKIATVFDDYLVYRPDLLDAWELEGHAGPKNARGRSSEEAWQCELWLKLVAHACQGKGQHLARRLSELQALALAPGTISNLPARVSVFGVSAMPGAFIEAFCSLSRAMELHFFMLGPSPTVWERARAHVPAIQTLLTEQADPARLATVLASEDGLGHPSLESSGRVARDFEAQVLASSSLRSLVGRREGSTATGGDTEEQPHNRAESEAPPRDAPTLLSMIQSDIRADRRRGIGRAMLPPLPIDPADDSIRFHSCHGPMREVEVLRDQLLDLFERTDPTLRPRDIIVMVPDIERYAPYIEAVFGRRMADSSYIPYGIADREIGATHLFFSALERALEVLRGRMTASDVVELLAVDAVGTRFGISEEDLPSLRYWVHEAGIRWGVDAEHRRISGQPSLDQNTWRLGLQRLLLGYSLPDATDTPYRGLLPAAAAEGGEAELVGRLAQAGEALFGLQMQVKGRKTVQAWREALEGVIETLLDEGWQQAAQRRQLLRALGSVERNALEEGFTEAVDLDTILGQMGRFLHEDAPPHGFLDGGLTFCALAPMRAIPFRVVCLMGMSEGAFPRVGRRAGFDLLQAQDRIGDRDPRDVDRYLFLEALLAARERLIISYEGQRARDGRALPPSVLVSELLDLIADSAKFEAMGSAEDPADERLARAHQALVLEHPSQPFSRRYFDADPRLFSYSRRFSGLVDSGRRTKPSPFFDDAGLSGISTGGGARDLEPLDEGERRLVSFTDLQRFLLHPSKFLFHSLGLYLNRETVRLEDREPMVLDGLSRWQVGDAWLRNLVKGMPESRALERSRQSGQLPLGTVGEIELGDLGPAVARLEDLARPYLAGNTFAQQIDLALDRFRLEGNLEGLRPEVALTIRFGRLRPQDELLLWSRHLLLCALAPSRSDEPPLPTESVLIAEDGKSAALEYKLAPVPEPRARELLIDLLELFEIGERRPLPFFPNSSKPYAETMRKRGDRRAALASVRDSWVGGRYASSDPYLRRAFGDFDPAEGLSLLRSAGSDAKPPEGLSTTQHLLEGELGFEILARRIVDPLLDALEADG